MHLENELIRIGFDDDTGGFTSILDKERDHEYIAAPDRALLLRLMVPEEDRACAHVDGDGATVRVSGEQALIQYCLDDIKVEAAFQLAGPAVKILLQIRNLGPRTIEEIMFPWVRGLGPLPDASVVWPNFWKRRVDDLFGTGLGGDHHTWNEWPQKLVSRYPAHLASAWCDYGNAAQGLGLEARHTDFAMLDFFLHKVVEKTLDPVRRTLDLTCVQPRRVRPGESCAFPPTWLSVHSGDWHATADAHRTWLETWLSKPDRPAKCAEAIGWHFFFMKHQDGFECGTYADLPRMAAAALAAGCPYLLVFGWQTGGHDNNYFYRYVPNEAWGGEKALREALDTCRTMGVEVIPFFNGTLANVELPEHKQFGHAWEAKTREGHAYYAGDWARHNFDAPTRNRAMLHHEICFCDEQRPYFLDTVRRLVQDYGFGNTQLDQISEKMFPCYNEAHGHGRPDVAMVDGLRKLLPETRALVRAANPEGIVISECLNEFTGQWCDSSWDWNILLPFPEPILYTLPWLMASHEVDALEFGEVNKAFAYKLHLDMKIDGGNAPVTKYPAFAEHIRKNAALRRALGEYYCDADFRDQEGVEARIDGEALVKTYRHVEQKKVGIVVAETAGKEATVTLKSTWRAAGNTVAVLSNFAADEQVPASAEYIVGLRPYEVRAVCIELKR